MLRIIIIVPQDASEEYFQQAVSNLRALVEKEFDGDDTSVSAEIGIRCSDAVTGIEISARGVPNGKDGLIKILNSVVTTFGHEFGGEIECADTGITYSRKVFAEA